MKKTLTLTFLCFLFFQSINFAQSTCGIATNEPPGCLLCSPVYTGKTSGYTAGIPGIIPCGRIENNQWLRFIADQATVTATISASDCANPSGQQGVELIIFDQNLNPVSNCFSSGGATLVGTVTANNLVPGNIYLIMIDGFLGDFCSFTLVVNGLRTKFDRLDQGVRMDPDLQIVCPGATVTFAIDSIPGATNFRWTLPAGAQIIGPSNGPTITVQFLSVGGGVVCVTPTNDCFSVAPYCRPIVVQPIPPTVVPPIDVCQEDFPYRIGNQVFNGPGIFNRFFQTDLGCDSLVIYTINQIITPPTFIPPQIFCADDYPVTFNGTRFRSPGLYSITYNSSKGCDSLVSYFMLSYPTSLFIIDTTLCEGECFEIRNQRFCTAGVYDVIFPDADQYGCDSLVKVFLDYNKVVSTVAQPNQLGCTQGSTVVLNGNGSSAGPEVDYRWYTSNGSIVGPDTNITALAGAPGMYFLDVIRLQDGVVCVATDTAIVTINTVVPDTPVFVSGPATVCQGTSATYTIGQLANFDTLKWTVSPNVPFSRNGNSITVNWNQSGIGQICVTAANDCGDSAPACFTVEVIPVPTSAFVVSDTICLTSTATVQYTGNAAPGAAYNWTFNGGTPFGSGPGPFQVQWATGGLKTVSLQVNDKGCVSTIQNALVQVDNPLQSPVINCNSTTSSIDFVWNAIPGATVYEVLINGVSQGLQANTDFAVSGLQPNEEVDIQVIANGNSACGPSSSGASCQAQECPPVKLSIFPIPDICRDENTAPIQLIYDLSGDDGSGILSWSGPGIDNNGVFNPSNGNLGVNTITLNYVNGSCSYVASVNLNVNEAPVATFSAEAIICENTFATINYNGNASVNANYSWNFSGGNNTNNGSGPGPFEINWPTPGNYTVSLSVEENGCSSSLEERTIQVDPELAPLVLSCETTNNSILFSWMDVPNASDFNANILLGPAGSLAGNTYEITGLDPGTAVTLEVIASGNTICGPSKDTLTCETKDCPPLTIEIDPVAKICKDGNQPTINLQALVNGSQGNGTFTWSGPGVSPDGQLDANSPSLVPGAPNRIRVLYEENGCSYETSRDIEVNEKPLANFSVNSPICLADTTQLTYTGTVISGATYTWETDGGQPASFSGQGPHFVTWNEGGAKEVSLLVDNDGCPSDTVRTVIEVDLPLEHPQVSCNVTNYEIQFSWLPVAGATNYDVVVVSGPGGSFNGPTTYQVEGLNPGDSVTIVLTSSGVTACGPVMDTVQCITDDCLSPIPGFTFSTNQATLTFSNNSQNSLTYLWDFGDGTTSTEENPIHTFGGNGNYPVSLTAFNDCDTVTTVQQININGALPVANFRADKRRFCAPGTVQFTDQSNGNPVAWEWTFTGGNPASSTEQNPVVQYLVPGAYGVTLRVTNAFGSNNIIQTAYIIVESQPIADFSVSQSGLDVQFNNTSTGAFTYVWDFGDGNTSFEENPLHTYSQAGEYEVTLTISNSCGTEVKMRTITVTTSNQEDLKFLDYLKVFPNPNEGNFFVEMSGKPFGTIQFQIINMLGQKMWTGQSAFLGGKLRESINLDYLRKGVYMLEIRRGEETVTKRLIIQ